MAENDIRFVESTTDMVGEAERMLEAMEVTRKELVDGEYETRHGKAVVKGGEIWVEGVKVGFGIEPTPENYVAIQELYGMVIGLMPSGDW